MSASVSEQRRKSVALVIRKSISQVFDIWNTSTEDYGKSSQSTTKTEYSFLSTTIPTPYVPFDDFF